MEKDHPIIKALNLMSMPSEVFLSQQYPNAIEAICMYYLFVDPTPSAKDLNDLKTCLIEGDRSPIEKMVITMVCESFETTLEQIGKDYPYWFSAIVSLIADLTGT